MHTVFAGLFAPAEKKAALCTNASRLILLPAVFAQKSDSGSGLLFRPDKPDPGKLPVQFGQKPGDCVTDGIDPGKTGEFIPKRSRIEIEEGIRGKTAQKNPKPIRISMIPA